MIPINREWSMPNSNTFDIKCIKKLIEKYHNDEMLSIDPFANKNKIAKITNDIDPDMQANHCLDAIDFIRLFEDNSIDFVFFDPPFSPRQVSECYRKLGRTVSISDTQSSFWSLLKKEISRVLKVDGLSISCGWNSNGIGKTNGFEAVEILLVAHGSQHNDTICIVEKKTNKHIIQ